MIKKLFQNQQEKVKTGFWLLNRSRILYSLFYLLILFLPTQFGKHFWPNFSFVFGLRLDYLSPTVYITDLLILLIFVCYFAKIKKIIAKTNKKYLLAFGLFLLSMVVGVIGAKNPLAGFYGIIKFLEFSFLAFFVVNNFKAFNKQVLFILFLTGIVFESLLAIFQYFNQGSLGGVFYLFGERAFNAITPGVANASINGQLFLRPYATFSHPNVLAGFLIFSMLLLILFSFKEKHLIKFTILGSVFGTAALLLTLSRAAIFLWLIYLIVLFGLSLDEKYKKRKFNSLQAVLLILIIVGITIILFLQNNYIVQRFLTTNLLDESLMQRQELMTQSLDMFWKNPILGVGVNNFFNNLVIGISKQNDFLIQPVHNIFLLVLSETGVIGFVFVLSIFIKSIAM